MGNKVFVCKGGILPLSIKQGFCSKKTLKIGSDGLLVGVLVKALCVGTDKTLYSTGTVSLEINGENIASDIPVPTQINEFWKQKIQTNIIIESSSELQVVYKNVTGEPVSLSVACIINPI